MTPRESRFELAAALALAAVALAVAGAFPLSNADAFGHLAGGRVIIELGHVPDHDGFSFVHTPPVVFRNHNWAASVAFYAVYDLGGALGLFLLKIALLWLTAALLLLRARASALRFAPLVCSVLIVSAIPAIRIRLTERPELFGFFFCAVFLWGLTAFARARSPRERLAFIALLVSTQLVWMNTHGSAPLALGLTAVSALCHGRDRAQRPLFLVLFTLQALSTGVTPWGFGLWMPILEHALDPAMRASGGMREWMPWTVEDPLWYIGSLGFQIVLLGLCLRTLARRGPADLALAVSSIFFAYMAVRAARYGPYLMLMATPAIAIAVAKWLEAVPARRVWSGLAAAAVCASLVAAQASAALPPHEGIRVGENHLRMPAAAAAWLRAHLRAPRLACGIPECTYLEFAVPGSRVWLDYRTAVFSIEDINRVAAATADGRAFVAMMDRHEADVAVLSHVTASDWPAVAALRADPRFALVTVEDRYVSFVRRERLDRSGRAQDELRVLGPGYDPARVLEADPAALHRELARFETAPSARALVRWIRGVRALGPLLRPNGFNGLRAPRTAEERKRLETGHTELARAARALPDLPAAQLYFALAAIERCDLPAAREATRLGQGRARTRPGFMLDSEIRLRDGHAEEVRRDLAQARQIVGAGNDPWVEALLTTTEPPACSASESTR